LTYGKKGIGSHIPPSRKRDSVGKGGRGSERGKPSYSQEITLEEERVVGWRRWGRRGKINLAASTRGRKEKY